MNFDKAVKKFYEWDLTGRGYLLFPYPVNIEPLFKKFYYSFNSEEYVDDGKTPTFFERLFSKKKAEIENENEDQVLPEEFEYSPFLKQINISFSKIVDLDTNLAIEFLNMLSESEDQISFEIIGRHKSIDFQIVCSNDDHRRIYHLLIAYFSQAIIKIIDLPELPFELSNKVLIVDFGYNEEFIRPINTSIDVLTSIMAAMDHLKPNECVLLQIIFNGVKNSWANNILNSVTIGSSSFFPDSPEMLDCAKKKVSNPLFSVVIRLAVQSNNPYESERLAIELIQNISVASRSEYNSLIPLNNEGYKYEEHIENVKLRGTSRYGMIMNSNELVTFVHFPDSPKLINYTSKTKAVPESVINNQYLIGINEHMGNKKAVTLSDSQRLRHCHIIGATGTGKSTFIQNLFLEDVIHGNGCVIFDPHGDTVEDIIPFIPEERLKDVILIDPSDSEYSIGINLLSAKTEIEKIVLSSDLVESFRRHSTSWGDQMTSVLSNAINVFLNSSKGGTLVDLKRFLLENSFRKEFLKTVDDRSIHYYWDNEFILLKKLSIGPLITRLDTFLRPRTIRYILSQNEGIDFNEVISKKKILLVKLSQGLIGEENSYLLGTLILSKIYQVAQARQSLSKDVRDPFYIYLDEFQNFITPSINSILSGARKYGIGLVLAHQELSQIKDTDVANSVLSNANIRICFRLGDFDAKKLESGFSYFDSNDLQNLNIGEAIVRVGKHTDDFSLKTFLLEGEGNNENRDLIIQISREQYSKNIAEIEERLNTQYGESTELNNSKPEEEKIREEQPKKEIGNIEEKSKEYLDTYTEKKEIREHRYLQTFIKKVAEQRGFKASLEELVENGRVDVDLVKDSLRIACEVAVNNSVEYEVRNINKCINAGYSFVCVISNSEMHLESIKKKFKFEYKDNNAISYLMINQLITFLDSFNKNDEKDFSKVKGYRVKVNYI